MQAIQTKYHGPTNHRGSRITARCDAGSLTLPYDYALNIEGNHIAAARELALKLSWLESGKLSMHSGCLPDGTYAHVFVRMLEQE